MKTIIAADEKGLLQLLYCETENDQEAIRQLEDHCPGRWFVGFLDENKNKDTKKAGVTVYFDTESDGAESARPEYAKIYFTEEILNSIVMEVKKSQNLRELLGAKLSVLAPLAIQQSIQWGRKTTLAPLITACPFTVRHSP